MPVLVEDLLRVAEVDTSNPHDFNGKEQDLSISKLSSAAFNITLLLPHGPRTPKEGISQRNLKFWADVTTKYASAVPKNLGLGFDVRPCSEGDFLTGLPYSMSFPIEEYSILEYILDIEHAVNVQEEN